MPNTDIESYTCFYSLFGFNPSSCTFEENKWHCANRTEHDRILLKLLQDELEDDVLGTPFSYGLSMLATSDIIGHMKRKYPDIHPNISISNLIRRNM